jgi:uncharacterized protein (DUF885 family)
MKSAGVVLALALAFARGASATPVPAPAFEVPAPAATAETQVLAPWIARFEADLDSVEHTHDITAGPRREAALRALYTTWLAALDKVDPATLGNEDRIDHALFGRELRHRLERLDFERRRIDAAAPLLPKVDTLIALAEDRRALVRVDARAAADTLNQANDAIAALDKRIDKDAKSAPVTDPFVAHRAARLLDGVRNDLKDWFAFYDGYDPEFTYWTRQPYAALAKRLEAHSKLLRDTLAGASDPEKIIGDPIGRDALVAELRYELIPYTPEELIVLAERELAWTQAEMTKAAKEMGHDDWRDALEAVKRQGPLPGEQPTYVVKLADEAIDYVTRNDLVTVPALARRDWRMTMLSPESQLQAPFFLGGEDVWVAYPHESMPQEKKRMALRGNNRAFSRAVVHHELIPGHHLQHFYEQRYQTHRELFDTPFWTEGWSLYWELLLYERGFAATPEEKIGMLFWRSHRAARILFSLSFHLGRMTPEQAVDLLVTRVGHERENAAAEVRRSFAGDYGPLYQAAYLLGGLQFRELHRELVESGKMTDRQFHDAILMGGPMPVPFVRARLTGKAPDPNWRFYPGL